MITKFDNTDIEIIMDIWQNTNISAHNFISDKYWIDMRPMVKDMLPMADIYVIRNDNIIVGFIGINQQHIEGIFIDQEYQSYGYGKRLLDFAKDINEELTLSVYAKNYRAYKFYTREGFTEIERSFDNNGEHEIKMIWNYQSI